MEGCAPRSLSRVLGRPRERELTAERWAAGRRRQHCSPVALTAAELRGTPLDAGGCWFGDESEKRMGEYLRSRLVRVGLATLVVGTGPLILIIVLAGLGVLSDPNPNPVGPGILAGLTFWPGIICVVVGVIKVARRKQ